LVFGDQYPERHKGRSVSAMSENVLVVGAILLDVKGKPDEGLEPNTSNPAMMRITRGGTARNVAENLGRLGADVILISAVGNDLIGEQLKHQTADTGVNLEYTLVVDGASTGTYIAVLEEDGSLAVALDDVSVMAHITPGYLDRNRILFQEADMVMMDGSLTIEAMKTVVRLCEKYHVPLCADPSSARLAYKLRPYLPHLHLVVPNEGEAVELCQVRPLHTDLDFSLELARSMVQIGVENAIVTLSDFGLAYATSDEAGYVPPRYSEMVDSTGTGDAVTAAIMFGMLNGLPAIEAIRLGAAAAGLTLQTDDTVVPDLSLDMLYDHLII
jgi:pseudouridine kinase